MIEIRCSNCDKKLLEANPEAKIKTICPRCKTPYSNNNEKLIKNER